MNQIIFIRILATILFIFILGIFVFRLIFSLITGKIKNWYRGLTNKQREKFKQKYKNNFKNNTLTVYRKDNPKGFYMGIIFNIIMIIFALIVGFLIYQKLF